jgi:LPS O-antigen subunit length determinant protein (WzzB/FepE family)
VVYIGCSLRNWCVVEAEIILIVVSIVLSLVGLQFLLVVAYVAVQHYKYHAAVKKIETKLQPVKEKFRVLAERKKTPV